MKIYKLSLLSVLTISLLMPATCLFAKNSKYSEVIKEENKSYLQIEQKLQHYKKLVKHKADIKKLSQESNTKQINILFDLDSRALNDKFNNKDLSKVDSLYFDLVAVYKNIPSVKYQLEYDSAMISFLRKKYDKAQKHFEDIYINDNNFTYKDNLIFHLQYLYLISDQNQKAISIFND